MNKNDDWCVLSHTYMCLCVVMDLYLINKEHTTSEMVAHYDVTAGTHTQKTADDYGRKTKLIPQSGPGANQIRQR